VGFEPTITPSERAKIVHALDRAVTVTHHTYYFTSFHPRKWSSLILNCSGDYEMVIVGQINHTFGYQFCFELKWSELYCIMFCVACNFVHCSCRQEVWTSVVCFSYSRQNRNMMEKHRRDKMNAHISNLALLVPTVANSPKKMDKTSILRLTAAFLRLHKCE
jgi:hypothetical protein